MGHSDVSGLLELVSVQNQCPIVLGLFPFFQCGFSGKRPEVPLGKAGREVSGINLGGPSPRQPTLPFIQEVLGNIN